MLRVRCIDIILLSVLALTNPWQNNTPRVVTPAPTPPLSLAFFSKNMYVWVRNGPSTRDKSTRDRPKGTFHQGQIHARRPAHASNGDEFYARAIVSSPMRKITSTCSTVDKYRRGASQMRCHARQGRNLIQRSSSQDLQRTWKRLSQCRLDLTVREVLVALFWEGWSMDSQGGEILILLRYVSCCFKSCEKPGRALSGSSSTLLHQNIIARDSNGKVSRVVALSKKSGGLSSVSPLPRPISILYFHGDHSAEPTASLSGNVFPQERQNGFT